MTGLHKMVKHMCNIIYDTQLKDCQNIRDPGPKDSLMCVQDNTQSLFIKREMIGQNTIISMFHKTTRSDLVCCRKQEKLA